MSASIDLLARHKSLTRYRGHLFLSYRDTLPGTDQSVIHFAVFKDGQDGPLAAVANGFVLSPLTPDEFIHQLKGQINSEGVYEGFPSIDEIEKQKGHITP